MTYIIGEIGINHNGDLDKAIQLIDAAKNCGIDAVKFQKRSPDICVPEHQKDVIRETPWGTMTYLEYKKVIEFEKKEYDTIDQHCRAVGIDWSASVWDIPSFHFINRYDVPFIKVPSALITYTDLLKEINTHTSKRVIISTGGSTPDQIDRAVQMLDNCIDSILLCNSSYPSSHDQIDINAMKYLKAKYNTCKVGYSGHEVDLLPSIVAASAGAQIIERHITLDKNMWGTDHRSSLDIPMMNELVSIVRNVEVILGIQNIKVYPDEITMMDKLRLNH